MAGFEVIVRPVVFPNIRPAPARSLLPEDDPTQGFAVLSGVGGKLIDLPSSESRSTSRSKPVETKRRFDIVRIYQMGANGKINWMVSVDVEIVNKVWTDTPQGEVVTRYSELPQPLPPNMQVLERDVVRWARTGAS
jgi:hypothetical protein